MRRRTCRGDEQRSAGLDEAAAHPPELIRHDGFRIAVTRRGPLHFVLVAGELCGTLLEERGSTFDGVVAVPRGRPRRFDELDDRRVVAAVFERQLVAGDGQRSELPPAGRPTPTRRRGRRAGGWLRCRTAAPRCTSPRRSASPVRREARTRRRTAAPSSGRRRGRAWPRARRSRCAGVAMRRSAAAASCAPAPSAGPSIDATTGTPRSPKPRSTADRSAVNCPCSTPVRSAPALNAGGAPVITTTRACRTVSEAWRASSSSNVGWSTALRLDGRSRVSRTTAPVAPTDSTRTVMGVPEDRTAAALVA